VDETYVKIAGRWTYRYRAIDQHGQVIDALVTTRRDAPAARRFFAAALRLGLSPVEVVTDRAPVYPRGHCCINRSRSGWQRQQPPKIGLRAHAN
jgi:transposase-like protein